MAFSRNEFLEQLQEVDSYEFEQFVAKLWELQNWDTYVTKGADDGGIDVIAEQSKPFPKKQVIQVKRYEPSNSVGRPDVQQYASIRQEQTDVDTVVVVTTGRFTDGAEEVAKKLNVKLIDGPQLYNLIDALDAFQLAQSYIDPEVNRGGNAPTDVEAGTTDTSRKADTVKDSQLITEFNEDTQPEDIPKFLPSIIKIRGDIGNNLQRIQSKLDSAEEAFHQERYFDAVEKYEEVNRRREELRREIVRYDAGLTYVDSNTIDHLPSTQTFTTQLAQITEKINEQSQEAFRIAERTKGLEQLVIEIRDRVDTIEDCIERGDQMRHSGEVEKGHSKYKQAKHSLEEVRKTMEIYQGLVKTYDDAVIESHQELPQGISLSKLETEITTRIDSIGEHLEIPKVAEMAAGSFSARLLTGNSGELFDKDLIEYIDEGEKLEFVFKIPRKGFRIASSEGTEESQHDALEAGSCFLLISDQRILYIAGVDDHDETQSIKYDRISDVTTSTESTSPNLQFTNVDGTKYKFVGVRDHTSDLEPAAKYIGNNLQ